MKFRYKITSQYMSHLDSTQYNITIQEYIGLRFHKWTTLETVDLCDVLTEISSELFNEYQVAYWSIPASVLYDELNKYNSMDEIVMKYIMKVALKHKKVNKQEKECWKLIDKFVQPNQWRTIEIKENEN